MEDLNIYNSEGSDLRRMQLKMLSILDTVVAIFEENDIPYWLDGGTLLGAVRHGGFIPWDDDIDIDVPSSHYKRAMSVLEKNLPDDLYLQRKDSSYKEKWIKIKDKYSVLEEKSSENQQYRGIFIDIFEAKYIGNNEHRFKRGVDRYIRKYRQNGNVTMRRFMKIIYKVGSPFFVFEKKSLFMTDDLFARWAFPLTLLEPMGRTLFEGKEYNAPNDTDLYLRLHYGDYMEIPKPEDRVVHASEIIFLEKE